MKWTYDPQADAAYLTVRKQDGVISVGLCGEVILDLDPVTREVVGIEVIGERSYLKLRSVLGEPEML